jgi:hypothetical protein
VQATHGVGDITRCYDVSAVLDSGLDDGYMVGEGKERDDEVVA